MSRKRSHRARSHRKTPMSMAAMAEALAIFTSAGDEMVLLRAWLDGKWLDKPEINCGLAFLFAKQGDRIGEEIGFESTGELLYDFLLDLQASILLGDVDLDETISEMLTRGSAAQ